MAIDRRRSPYRRGNRFDQLPIPMVEEHCVTVDAGAVHLVVESLSTMGAAIDPVAAVAALFAPAGRLTARCRESYEFRLHRALGWPAP